MGMMITIHWVWFALILGFAGVGLVFFITMLIWWIDAIQERKRELRRYYRR